MSEVRRRMKDQGYRLVKRRGRKISGWTLWVKAPG